MAKCTAEVEYPELVTVSAALKCIISFFGTLGNATSLWCLVQCRKTNPAVRIHLVFVFSVLLGICLITLPGVTFINYISAFCKVESVPQGLRIFFSISNSVLLQIDRINFTAIAGFKMIAVFSPHRYQSVTKLMVVVLEVFICTYALLPWLFGIFQDFQYATYNGRFMAVDFGHRNSTLNNVIYIWYGVNYCLPFLLTLVAYLLMTASMIHQKQNLGMCAVSASTMDHVTYTLRVVLLTNLVLDGPHVIVHQLQEQRLASIITHMIFYLHLLIDPLVFVGLNLHYRRLLLRRLAKSIPAAFSAYLGLSSSASDDNEVGDTPLKPLSNSLEQVDRYKACESTVNYTY
ncbi:C-C chemokine receptor type 8-like [Homarus americanus]|uniref:C-C chemokine receptor type 8-like n=1 Tax=Homarus americanus TaxID=6706 RepID=UPI001C475227|nr:C-C chemokine receptor type 8-like [Homarus americanus]